MLVVFEEDTNDNQLRQDSVSRLIGRHGGAENDGHEIAGHENARHENTAIVTMEGESETAAKLSNGTSLNDLQ